MPSGQGSTLRSAPIRSAHLLANEFLRSTGGTNPIHNKKPKKASKEEDEDDKAFKAKQQAGSCSHPDTPPLASPYLPVSYLTPPQPLASAFLTHSFISHRGDCSWADLNNFRFYVNRCQEAEGSASRRVWQEGSAEHGDTGDQEVGQEMIAKGRGETG